MTSEPKALAIIPRTVEEVRSLAAMFAKSSLLPPDLRGKEADVFVSIMAGQELGLPPMAALRGVHVVKGKPVLAADSMVGIVLGSGLAEYFSCVEETETSVTYETKRRGAPHPQRVTWTDDDTKRAGLNGDNWQKYKRQMRRARCKAMLARDVYPDVLAGCYEDDEARELSGPAPRGPANANSDAIDAEFTDAPTGEPRLVPEAGDPLAHIDAAENADQLKALAPSLAKLQGDLKAQARTRYRQRMHKLTQSDVDAAGGAA